MKQIHKGVEFSAVESAEEAVKTADIICTCTMAKEPILKGMCCNIISRQAFETEPHPKQTALILYGETA